jgi:hypothetical protein
MSRKFGVLLAVTLSISNLAAISRAHAQNTLPSLPPPQVDAPVPASTVARPAEGAPPSAAPASAAVRPPEYVYIQSPAAKRAPKYGRLGALTYGGSFYEYQVGSDRSQLETTGNIVRPGVALEVDIGVRLARRYVPYLFLEHGVMQKGRFFEGTDARVASDYLGIGFRTIFADPDEVGFVTDIALGVRTLSVSNATQSWSISALELFRFGLGAEIRVTSKFVLSPMFTVSTGSMSDTSGSISYASTSAIQGPVFQNGASVTSSRVYIVAGLGCGAHFELFGK